MRKYVIGVFLLFIFTAGCGQSEADEEYAFPEVNFTMSQSEANLGMPIVFDAFVSIEGKPITNADRVEFEIWHESQEDGEHESILINHTEGGHYRLEKSFETPGIYYIYYHVDSMGLHLMEKFDFFIK